MATNGTTAKEVIMRPPPKQLPPPKTVTVGDLSFQATMIEGRPYPRVHNRVEAAHDRGGYNVISHEVKEIAGIWCYEVVIELPNGQRFPGTAEINKAVEKPIAKAETRAIGRALAFAGFHIKSSIASEEEMEDIIEGRGEVIVSEQPNLKEEIGKLGRQLFTERADFETFLYSYTNQDTGKIALQPAYNALKAKAREKLNEHAAEQESEEDAHLIPDEQLETALVHLHDELRRFPAD